MRGWDQSSSNVTRDASAYNAAKDREVLKLKDDEAFDGASARFGSLR